MNAPQLAVSQFSDVSPGTLQQFTTLLLERLASSELPELGGMIRLHGRWTDPGRASGKSYYGAKIVDDGGAQAKVEIDAGRSSRAAQNFWPSAGSAAVAVLSGTRPNPRSMA